MSGLFHRLATRAMGDAAVAEPIVPSMFAPAVRNVPTEMVVEQTEVAVRPANANASSTLPSVQTSPTERVVREAFEQRHSRDQEPIRPIEPHTIRSVDPPRSQPTRSEPKRFLPHLLNSTVPEHKPLDGIIDQGPTQLPVQTIAFNTSNHATNGARREPVEAGASPANVIRVSIGRIDVRAEMPAPIPPPVARQRPSGMSLEEYSKLRAEGKR